MDKKQTELHVVLVEPEIPGNTGNIARQLMILTRTQNDWKAVSEMDSVLRTFNSDDPALYDFALFGIGVSKDF